MIKQTPTGKRSGDDNSRYQTKTFFDKDSSDRTTTKLMHAEGFQNKIESAKTIDKGVGIT